MFHPAIILKNIISRHVILLPLFSHTNIPHHLWERVWVLYSYNIHGITFWVPFLWSSFLSYLLEYYNEHMKLFSNLFYTRLFILPIFVKIVHNYTLLLILTYLPICPSKGVYLFFPSYNHNFNFLNIQNRSSVPNFNFIVLPTLFSVSLTNLMRPLMLKTEPI